MEKQSCSYNSGSKKSNSKNDDLYIKRSYNSDFEKLDKVNNNSEYDKKHEIYKKIGFYNIKCLDLRLIF